MATEPTYIDIRAIESAISMVTEPTYLHQTYLPIPFPASRSPHPTQPFTDMAIERWLIANKDDALRWDVIVPGYLGLSDVPSDQALCIVLLAAYEFTDEIYLDTVNIYSLFLGADIPKTSNINKMYHHSPLAALAMFEGDRLDAPGWTRLVTPDHPLLFRQPRGAIAEVFSALSLWEENRHIKRLPLEIAGWAAAVAAKTPAESRLPTTPEKATLTTHQGAPRRGRAERWTGRRVTADASPCVERGRHRFNYSNATSLIPFPLLEELTHPSS